MDLYRKPLQILFGGVFCIYLLGCSHSEHVSNKTVLHASSSQIRGFDPARVGDVASIKAMSKIYEGLYQIAYNKKPYTVIPLLAESLPKISDNGLTYTIRLKRGIQFQDDPCFDNGKGREVTVKDVIYSIKRIADAKNTSSGFWAFKNRIKGLDDFHKSSLITEVTDYTSDIEGFEYIDPYTFSIHLLEPYPQLMWILTMHYAFVIPKEAVDYYGDDFMRHPVGTGPYKLKSWKRNYKIEYTRNPSWHQATGGSQSPVTKKREAQSSTVKPVGSIDRITEYIISDPHHTMVKFLVR